ncbi:MAG: integration host factor subunit alpha [Beijerinckiaceae bacterium]
MNFMTKGNAHKLQNLDTAANGGKGANVTRADLATAVYGVAPMTRREAAQFVDDILEDIAAALVRGEHVLLSGFGKFSVRQKGPRIGRNPKTKVETAIPPQKSPVFRPSHIMKRRVAGLPVDGE